MTAREYIAGYLQALPKGTPVATLPVAWVAELIEEGQPVPSAVPDITATPWPERIRLMDPNTHLSAAEVAQAIGCGTVHGVHRRRNVKEMRARGLQPLPFHQPGGPNTALYFKAGEVVRWMDGEARTSGREGLRLAG